MVIHIPRGLRTRRLRLRRTMAPPPGWIDGNSTRSTPPVVCDLEMLKLLHFYNNRVRVPGVTVVIAGHGPSAMLPSLSSLTNRWAAATAASRPDGVRVGLIALPHLAALGILALTEYALEQRLAFLLAWG